MVMVTTVAKYSVQARFRLLETGWIYWYRASLRSQHHA